MTLSDRQVKQVKPRDKDFKLADEKGMFLLVKKNGSKYWRLKYRFEGKEKMLALGVYPDVSLKDARDKRSDARTLIAKGVDPSEVRKVGKQINKLKAENTFESIAREWWKNQKGSWTESYTDRVMNSFEVDIFPQFGDKPVIDIDPQEVLAAIRKVEGRGALDVSGRLLQRCSRVFRYAIQTGRATLNPAGDLQGVLETRKVIHQPSLPSTELPEFFERLNAYEGTIQTRLALRFLLLTFVRPGELRGAKWEEIDLDAKEWRIPAERMKMNTEHIVPLSKQAISVLETLRPITAQYELVFPGERRRNKPISENTLLVALYRMGYKNRATPHGFRATASSILNEQSFNRDAIERQLSHQERNQVRGAYTHHAEYLKERKKIMQWWADYLDDLEHGTNVIKGKFENKG
jgi:integrase